MAGAGGGCGGWGLLLCVVSHGFRSWVRGCGLASHSVVVPVDAVVVFLARGESGEPEEGSCDEVCSVQAADCRVGCGGDGGPEGDVAHDPCPQRELGAPRVVVAVHAHELAGRALGPAGPFPAWRRGVAVAVRTGLFFPTEPFVPSIAPWPGACVLSGCGWGVQFMPVVVGRWRWLPWRWSRPQDSSSMERPRSLRRVAVSGPVVPEVIRLLAVRVAVAGGEEVVSGSRLNKTIPAPGGRPGRRTGRCHAGAPSGGCSSTRVLYSTSWMRPSKVRCSVISRAMSG